VPAGSWQTQGHPNYEGCWDTTGTHLRTKSHFLLVSCLVANRTCQKRPGPFFLPRNRPARRLRGMHFSTNDIEWKQAFAVGFGEEHPSPLYPSPFSGRQSTFTVNVNAGRVPVGSFTFGIVTVHGPLATALNLKSWVGPPGEYGPTTETLRY
jgi:hypothetical protein